MTSSITLKKVDLDKQSANSGFLFPFSFLPYLVLLSTKASFDYLLLPEEEVYFNSMKSLESQRHFALGRSLTRFLFSRLLNKEPKEIHFRRDDKGKPYLYDEAAFPNDHYSFSLAHKKDWIALLIGAQPVGLDVEVIRPLQQERLAQKFFSEEEYAWMNQEGEKVARNRFFLLWSAKEAALKADGRGITAGLRHAKALWEGEEITALELDTQKWKIRSLLLTELLGEGKKEGFLKSPSLSSNATSWNHILDLGNYVVTMATEFSQEKEKAACSSGYLGYSIWK